MGEKFSKKMETVEKEINRNVRNEKLNQKKKLGKKKPQWIVLSAEKIKQKNNTRD
jgi:ribosomal silencing factor RsfS